MHLEPSLLMVVHGETGEVAGKVQSSFETLIHMTQNNFEHSLLTQ